MYIYGLRCFSSCLSLEKSGQLLKAQQNFLLFNAQRKTEILNYMYQDLEWEEFIAIIFICSLISAYLYKWNFIYWYNFWPWEYLLYMNLPWLSLVSCFILCKSYVMANPESNQGFSRPKDLWSNKYVGLSYRARDWKFPSQSLVL